MVSALRHAIFRPGWLIAITLPVAFLAILSVGSDWAWPGILPGNWTMDHWNSLNRGDRGLASGLFLSLVIAMTTSILATAAGFLSSRWIAYHRQRSTWLLAAYSPYVISPILYAIWLHIFFVRADLAGTLVGVMIGQFLLAYPYAVIFFQGFWGHRTFDFEQLGSTLGCRFHQQILHILIPMAKDMIAICLFQCFLISWFEFGLTSLIGVGQIKTLPILVYTFVQEANLHLAAVASLLLVLPVILISLANRNWILKR